jgi:signal peptidase II
LPSPATAPADKQKLCCPLDAACRSPRAIVLLLLVAGLGLFADLASKHAVFKGLLDADSTRQQIHRYQANFSANTIIDGHEVLRGLRIGRHVCPGMDFTLSTNPGVVFGWSMPRPAVNVATMLIMGLVLFFFATANRKAWLVHLAMGLILAGAMGNLYDRLFSDVSFGVANITPICHEVRDFIDCSQIGYKWVFNVADALLVMGVLAMAIHWFTQKPAKSGKSE